MEVHHHPDLHHKRKKIGEYFLEFLMLFFAVSLGFVAENIREGSSERKKEKEYVRSFVSNLKQDTMSLKKLIDRNEYKVRGIDSVLTLRGLDLSTPANRLLFYAYCKRHFSRIYFFRNNDATLSQLRNAGGYRLIQKDSAADKISEYDQRLSAMRWQEDAYGKSMFSIEEALFELMDMTTFTDTAYFHDDAATGKEFPPILNDTQKLRSFFNKVYFARLVVNIYAQNHLKTQLERSEKLISFLQKTYYLENE